MLVTFIKNIVGQDKEYLSTIQGSGKVPKE